MQAGNSLAHSEWARLSFCSHRSDAATRDQIKLSFAVVHESLLLALRVILLLRSNLVVF
jgi:hypothetical protein